MAKAYIGTSGWNYSHWRERFYPRGVSAPKWLSYYAQHFDTAEINYSFYRIPKRSDVKQWLEQTPSSFRFAIKLWRGITHYKKLIGCEKYLRNFLDVFELIPTRQRGPLLVQLPPQQRRDLDKLQGFLEQVKEATAPQRWKVAVEVRHNDWLDEELYRLLDQAHAALCVHDIERGYTVEPNEASFVYVRRHGGKLAYRGNYGSARIQTDAKRVRAWLESNRTVYVYYNNDAEGHAVRNALALRELLDA